MLSTLPLECFVCREVMFNYWFPNEPFNMNLHLIFTTALVVSAVMLSLITCDLGIVFELVGATSACALAYILPPLCFIKLSQRSRKTYLAAICVAFGILVMTISLFQVFRSDSSRFQALIFCSGHVKDNTGRRRVNTMYMKHRGRRLELSPAKLANIQAHISILTKGTRPGLLDLRRCPGLNDENIAFVYLA